MALSKRIFEGLGEIHIKGGRSIVHFVDGIGKINVRGGRVLDSCLANEIALGWVYHAANIMALSERRLEGPGEVHIKGEPNCTLTR